MTYSDVWSIYLYGNAIIILLDTECWSDHVDCKKREAGTVEKAKGSPFLWPIHKFQTCQEREFWYCNKTYNNISICRSEDFTIGPTFYLNHPSEAHGQKWLIIQSLQPKRRIARNSKINPTTTNQITQTLQIMKPIPHARQANHFDHPRFLHQHVKV
jgi:hypothetical protein